MKTKRDPKEVLGWKLMLARKMKTVTQEQAAYAAGVDPQTVSNWERGRFAAPFLGVAVLAAYYGAELAWLADPRESLPSGGGS